MREIVRRERSEGDAEVTDREMMSVSGHSNPQTLSIYSKRTSKQAGNAAKKRLALRRALEATENENGDKVRNAGRNAFGMKRFVPT
jgi:hypothetical protein